MAAAVGLTEQRFAPGANHVAAECLDSHNPLHMAMDGTNPYFVYDPAKCIVCYRCVRACEEVQGTFALTVEGRGFDSRIVAGMDEDFLDLRVRLLRRLRAGLPDGLARREGALRDRHARAFEDHHLRLLRRRLRLQGRDARRGGGAHGAVEGRQGQPRPLLRQGPLRLRLRHPPGAHPEADGAREDHRPVARDHLGGGDRPRRLRVPPHPGRVRPRLGRRHHLVALHQRGDLPRPEAHPPGLRRQQRRHLRPRLPLADRLRPQGDLRRERRHPGLRQRRGLRRDARHRRQPDRRPPGLRQPHEAPPARGRAADRRRPAPHRPRAHAPRRGRLPPRAQARHQRRAADRDGPRHRHRGPARPRLHPRPLRRGGLPRVGRVRRPRARTRPRPPPPTPASTRRSSARRRGSTPPAATRRSTTASASPSTARARPR